MNKVITFAFITLLAGVSLAGTQIRPLLQEEVLKHPGATHSITITAADLAKLAVVTNGTLTITDTVIAPVSIKFVGYELTSPFITTYSTNVNTSSLTFEAGVTGTLAQFVNPVQALAAATPTVVATFGNPETIVVTTNTLTGVVVNPLLLDSQTSNVSLTVTATFSNLVSTAIIGGQVRAFYNIQGVGSNLR